MARFVEQDGGDPQQRARTILPLDKMLAAIAVAIGAFVLTGALGRAVVHDRVPEHPAIPIVDRTPTGSPLAARPSAPGAGDASRAGNASRAGDASAGRAIVASSCAFCHALTPGAPPSVGPDLWGVAGRKIASAPGYDYSGALRAHAGADWNPANLDAWLQNPRGFAPGTKMYFVGLADPAQRADVIAFLETLGLKTPGGK